MQTGCRPSKDDNAAALTIMSSETGWDYICQATQYQSHQEGCDCDDAVNIFKQTEKQACADKDENITSAEQSDEFHDCSSSCSYLT